jgi:RecA/RadA recombinase
MHVVNRPSTVSDVFCFGENDMAIDEDELFRQSTQMDAEPADDATATDSTQEKGYWPSRFFKLSEFLERPDKEWLVNGVVGVGDLVLIFGESGHGKTHCALDLVFSCITGKTFAERFVVNRMAKVAYTTGEGTAGLSERLRGLVAYYGTKDNELPYVFTDTPQLFSTAGDDGVLAFLESWREMAAAGHVPEKLDMVVIDTLHNATASADENTARDASVTLRSLRVLRDVLGCAVVLVHHASRNGNERGSTALRAACDVVVRCQQENAGFLMSLEKSKDGRPWPTQAFSLVVPPGMTDGVRVAWDGDAAAVAKAPTRERRILEYLNATAGLFTADAIAVSTNDDSPGAVQNMLRKLRDAGSIHAVKEKRLASNGSLRDSWLYGRLDADPAVTDADPANADPAAEPTQETLLDGS